MGMAMCTCHARRRLEEAQFGEEGRIDEETFHLLGSEDFVGIVVRGTWRCPCCFSLVVTTFFLQNMWKFWWFADDGVFTKCHCTGRQCWRSSYWLYFHSSFKCFPASLKPTTDLSIEKGTMLSLLRKQSKQFIHLNFSPDEKAND